MVGVAVDSADVDPTWILDSDVRAGTLAVWINPFDGEQAAESPTIMTRKLKFRSLRIIIPRIVFLIVIGIEAPSGCGQGKLYPVDYICYPTKQ
jgi:hypothetical protein